jgi:divalent metal cation (Fe/Co/Zn/Cd) transporter
MNTAPLPLPVLHITGHASESDQILATRARLTTRARQLSILTIGWMTVEAAVALIAAAGAGSVALLGFGLDSLIELCSAATILWLYTRPHGQSEPAERRAQQIIAGCFLLLALYITIDAISTLASASHPDPSWPGVAVAVGALVAMPLLARAKNTVAIQLGSAATAGDAAQSQLCAISAAAVLITLLMNQALGAWWLDPITAIAIAVLALHEGRQAWNGEVCADCAPVRTGTVASPHCDQSNCC